MSYAMNSALAFHLQPHRIPDPVEEPPPPAVPEPLPDCDFLTLVPRELALAVICRRTIRDIVREVSERTGVPAHEIVGRSRVRAVAHARQEVMFEARHVLRPDGSFRYSLVVIGREIGRLGGLPPLHHATIIHGYRKHRERVRKAKLALIRAENERMARLHRMAA